MDDASRPSSAAIAPGYSTAVSAEARQPGSRKPSALSPQPAPRLLWVTGIDYQGEDQQTHHTRGMWGVRVKIQSHLYLPNPGK
jgi:hypothetical protein